MRVEMALNKAEVMRLEYNFTEVYEWVYGMFEKYGFVCEEKNDVFVFTAIENKHTNKNVLMMLVYLSKAKWLAPMVSFCIFHDSDETQIDILAQMKE